MDDGIRIAYFSMEFGLTECLPIYSGGLGILAGDHMKSASELGLPLVGVGLLYQQGYFQQYLNADGWQQETYPENDLYNLPIQLVTDENNMPVLIYVEFPGRNVYYLPGQHVRARRVTSPSWSVAVGPHHVLRCRR